ncbi:MAG TPA: hypothetical protein VFZ65_12865 [Planctomycetota bacterium]|nr:hypothetical protein [Planctomycetota bacterium]
MTRTLLALAALSLPAPAQPPAPVLAELTVAGPVAWRSRLGPTNLGTMLASAQAESIWRGYVDAVDATLRAARGADQEFLAERTRLLDYGGEVHVVAWLDQAEDAVHLPRWSAAVIAGPDGHSDLAAMAAQCNAWLVRAGASAATRWLQLELSPPRLHDGRLIAVLASAEDLEAATRRAQRFVCRALDANSVLRLEVAPQAALGLLRDRASERDVVAALIGPACARATLAIGSVGPRLVVDCSFAFGAGGRGVLRGLLPAHAKVVDLATLVPEGTATHYAWPVDLPAMWQGVVEVLAAATERGVPAMHERLVQWFGCDLGKDVWPLLEPEVLLLWRRLDAAEADDPDLLANACFVARVRDEAALVEAAGPVLRRAGATYQVGEDGVLWSEDGDYSLRIGFGIACVAFGARGHAQCEAVLDRAAAPRRRRAAAQHPPGAPAGWNAEGRMDVTTLVARDLYGSLRWLLFAFGGAQHLPEVLELQKEAARWLPVLREHRLDSAQTLGGVTERGWQLRILW